MGYNDWTDWTKWNQMNEWIIAYYLIPHIAPRFENPSVFCGVVSSLGSGQVCVWLAQKQ